MLFLGQASNYSHRAVWRQIFVRGNQNDSNLLRQTLADYYGVPFQNAILTANGRSALAFALKKLLKPGSKVLINGFTCHAVVESLEVAQCQPVYADIERQTLSYGPEQLQKCLQKNPDLKAIIIQNTLGIPVDIVKIETIAKKHHLIIIEDLAHAVGMFYPDGRKIGTVGAAAALSFGKSKQLDAITGGALIFNQRDIVPPKQPAILPKTSDNLRARFYPLFGRIGRATFRLHLNKIYYGAMIRAHLITRSGDVKLDLKTRPAHWQSKLILEQFQKLTTGQNTPIRNFALVKNRSSVLKKLRQNGYYFDEIWYDAPVAPIRFYESVNFPESDCPNSVAVAKEIINIPTYYKKSQMSSALKIINGAKIK